MEAVRSELEDYLDECRALVTAEITRRFDGSGELHDALYGLILDYPLREGKALRPALGIATCRALGGDVEAVLGSAATLELYHNAFLVHDDIEDESVLRRGGPTLHSVHGVPIAVNVGDAMLSLSLQPLLENTATVGLGPALRILAAVAQMTQESVEGQALELAWVRHNRWDLTDDDYVRMVVKKTGWYSFAAPMRIGAIAAGAPPEQVDGLVPFALSLSVAFQITDDVLNLQAAPEAYGKEIGGDLWEGKRTVVLLHALRTASDGERAEAVRILSLGRPAGEPPWAAVLDALVAEGHVTPAGRSRLLDAAGRGQKGQADVDWLFDLVQRQGSIDHARQVAVAHATHAAAALAALTWIPPSRHRRVLEDLVGYVHERAR